MQGSCFSPYGLAQHEGRPPYGSRQARHGGFFSCRIQALRGKTICPCWAAILRTAAEALPAACITCPAAGKRAPFVQDYLSGNRKVVHLFPLRSMLEAKAFYSPQLCWGGISLKHTIQKTLHSLKWLCSVFQMVRGARLELARCNHTPLKRARLPIPLPAQNAAPPLCCKRAVRGKAIPGLCCYVREGSCFTLLKRKFRL